MSQVMCIHEPCPICHWTAMSSGKWNETTADQCPGWSVGSSAPEDMQHWKALCAEGCTVSAAQSPWLVQKWFIRNQHGRLNPGCWIMEPPTREEITSEYNFPNIVPPTGNDYKISNQSWWEAIAWRKMKSTVVSFFMLSSPMTSCPVQFHAYVLEQCRQWR